MHRLDDLLQQTIEELIGEVLLTQHLTSRSEPTTCVGLFLVLLDVEGVHHVNQGLEVVADEGRVEVMRRLLHVLVHFVGKPNLHVLDVLDLLDMGPEVHGLVSGLGNLIDFFY